MNLPGQQQPRFVGPSELLRPSGAFRAFGRHIQRGAKHENDYYFRPSSSAESIRAVINESARRSTLSVSRPIRQLNSQSD